MKVYLELIAAVLEHLWSLTSDQNMTQHGTNDLDDFLNDFNDDDDFGAGSMQSSDREQYNRLMCKIFLKDCSVELLLIHLTNSCRSSAVEGTETAKPLSKLVKSVAQTLAKFAENATSRLAADDEHRVRISKHYSEKLATLFADAECVGFTCSADFVDVMNSFVPLMSTSVLVQLIVLLLQSPAECVVDGSETLSPRGSLMVRVLQHVVDRLDVVQPQMSTSISSRLCTMLKLVPSDDAICRCLVELANRTPLFASSVTQGAVSSLMKAGTPPSLNLMMALAADDANCKQMMVQWFKTHKMWKRQERLPLYVATVSFLLKECEKGAMLTFYFLYSIICFYTVSVI